MKKGIMWALFLPSMFLGFQTPKEELVDAGLCREKSQVEKVMLRGAEDVYVLSRTVYNSIKMNDFDMLATYIPNNEEIDYLKKHSTEKDRYLFEEMTAEDLKANTRLNFDLLVNRGMEKGINWSEVEIQESKIAMCKIGAQHMCEALMTLQDTKGNEVKISFDMIKIKERWFLFQGVRLKTEKASAE